MEPRPEVRDDIARTYFYMDGGLSGAWDHLQAEPQAGQAWDREDSVDDWERERAKRIEKIQGNRNPFVR